MNPYSQRVKYGESQEMDFLDFSLRYVGKSKVIPPMYPRGFIYYNFVVKANGSEQKIRWSSGTGMIAPQEFSAAGKNFWLELQHSDKLGPLAADELVVLPRETA